MLCALLTRLICHMYLSLYSWDFVSAPPFLPCFLLFASYGTYLVAENLATKEARKPNISAPLNLMLIQEAACINSVLVVASLASLLRLGGSWYVPIMGVFVMSARFYARLEQYLVGRLEIPAVNVVYDGPVLLLLVYFVSPFRYLLF